MSADLLTWLRARRDDARETQQDYAIQEDELLMTEWGGFAQAYDEVIQHIQFGGDQ